MPFCGACPSVSRMTCFFLARRRRQGLVGGVERGEDLGAAAGLRCARCRSGCARGAWPAVMCTMRVGCESNAMTSSRSSPASVSAVALRGLLGHLERQPRHRARAVDDQRHRDLGLVLALLGVHAHRQDPLDRRVVPAAEAVAVLAAGEEEAAAEVAHVLLEGSCCVSFTRSAGMSDRMTKSYRSSSRRLDGSRRARACRRRTPAR